jgi:hypothetical protein
MWKPSVLALGLVLFSVRVADATCMKTDDGCHVCCSGPDRCHTSCGAGPPIEWQSDATRRYELGVSGVVAGRSEDGAHGVGGRVSVSFHRLYLKREWSSSPMFGNELGVELAAERVWIEGATETQLSVTPSLRMVRASRVRIPSVFGVVVPEVGASLRPDAPAQIFFRWSLFPVDVLVTRHVAIAVEPVAVAVGIGGGVRGWVASSIGLRVVL